MLALAPVFNASMYSWIGWLTGPATWSPGNLLGPGSPVGMLRGGVAPDQTPYFYGWIHSVVKSGKTSYDHYDFITWICGANGVASMRALLGLQYLQSDAVTITDACIQYDVNGTGDAVHGVAAVFIDDGADGADGHAVYLYPQEGSTFPTDTPLDSVGNVSSLLWANMPAPDQWELLVQLPSGIVDFVDQTKQTNLYAGSTVGEGSLAP